MEEYNTSNCILGDYQEEEEEEEINFKPNKDDIDRIERQQTVSDFKRSKLEVESQKNWNLFYKRNGDRFFHNRYWTRREFLDDIAVSDKDTRYLLELGCGCGDFVLPLIEDDQNGKNFAIDSGIYIYCCDFAKKAIDILESHPAYQSNYPTKIKAFVCDITKKKIESDEKESETANTLSTELLDGNTMDIVSLIFVLSTLEREKMIDAIDNIGKVMSVGGIVLLRDYAIYDSAMLRFKESSKICDRFYFRQDGTRAYFFKKDELIDLFLSCSTAKFKIHYCKYINRLTENHASDLKYKRVFLQAKIEKIS